MAMPLLFSPVIRDSMWLVDGVLLSNVPVDAAYDAGVDKILAVDISSPLRAKDNIIAPWEIIDQATTIMSNLSKNLQSRKADILISPPLNSLKEPDIENTDTLIAIGYNITKKSIPAIRALLKPNYRTWYADCVKNFDLYCNEDIPDYLSQNQNLNKKRIPDCNFLNSDLDLLINSGIYKKVAIAVDTVGSIPEIYLTLKKYGKVKDIEIYGNRVINDSLIIRALNLKTGKRLNISVLNRGLERVISVYRDMGLSLMKFTSINWNEHSGTLKLVIDEGKIDEIYVMGNHRTLDYVILRDFRKYQDELFNWRAIQKSVKNVYATQLFDRVNVELYNGQGKNSVGIKVKEKSPWVFRLGGKVDNDRKSQVYLEFGAENILGTGVKAHLSGRIGTKDNYIGLKLRDDRIYITYLTFALNLYTSSQINPFVRNNNELGEYIEKRKGVMMQGGFQLGRLGQIIAELKLERILDDVYEGDFNLYENIELRTFAIRSITDRRDRVDFPTEGIYNHWYWQSGSQLLLNSGESFTKAQFDFKWFLTMVTNHSTMLRALIGIGDKSLPFSEQFRLGGMQNFYGFKEHEYFGRQLFLLSFGYRYKFPVDLNKRSLVFKNIYFSTRYDFGGIWSQPNLSFSSNDFISGFGANLGWDTLFGPLFIGWGKTSEGTESFYISLGLDF